MAERYIKRIPTELEIEILQCIADEDEGDLSRWHALLACALVCKAWAEHVQRHLYYAINMNIGRGACQFKCLRQYSHLRPFVRDFKWPRTVLSKSLYCFNESDADTIKDVAPAVMKLRFRRVQYPSLEPPLREAVSAFANIQELDMTGSTFEDWTTVVRVISSFPFLATLAMPRTATFRDDSPEVSYPPPSRLAHIKLAPGCETETVSWIRKGPTPNIRTVEAESKINSNILAKLLRLLAGSLQHLIIYIDLGSAFLPSELVKMYFTDDQTHHSEGITQTYLHLAIASLKTLPFKALKSFASGKKNIATCTDPSLPISLGPFVHLTFGAQASCSGASLGRWSISPGIS